MRLVSLHHQCPSRFARLFTIAPNAIAFHSCAAAMLPGILVISLNSCNIETRLY
uniref:Uncharacterized protein n=1 Tax=Arundo donax TaxID=35708 RepID=A0A0A8ZX13_ARUDO